MRAVTGMNHARSPAARAVALHRLGSRLGMLFAFACGLCGCRIGGSPAYDGDPRAAASGRGHEAGRGATTSSPGAGAMTGSSTNAGSSAAPADDGSSANPPRRDAGSSEPPVDAGRVPRPEPDAGASADASADASSPGDPGGSCGRTAQIAVCNPITNSGCPVELGMQCDVDLLAESLSGVCVFNAPPPAAGGCLAIPPTESCPAKQTCVDGVCQTVCLCDADCESGACCTGPLGSGFKTCTKC